MLFTQFSLYLILGYNLDFGDVSFIHELIVTRQSILCNFEIQQKILSLMHISLNFPITIYLNYGVFVFIVVW